MLVVLFSFLIVICLQLHSSQFIIPHQERGWRRIHGWV